MVNHIMGSHPKQIEDDGAPDTMGLLLRPNIAQSENNLNKQEAGSSFVFYGKIRFRNNQNAPDSRDDFHGTCQYKKVLEKRNEQ